MDLGGAANSGGCINRGLKSGPISTLLPNVWKHFHRQPPPPLPRLPVPEAPRNAQLPRHKEPAMGDIWSSSSYPRIMLCACSQVTHPLAGLNAHVGVSEQYFEIMF